MLRRNPVKEAGIIISKFTKCAKLCNIYRHLCDLNVLAKHPSKLPAFYPLAMVLFIIKITNFISV